MWDIKMVKYFGIRPSQLIMLLGDALVMQLALLIVVAGRLVFGPVPLHLYATMSSILLCAPIFSVFFGACQVPMPPPHREVKHIFLMVSMTYLIVLFVLFMTQSSVAYSRAIIICAWFISVFAVPMVRGTVRRRLCRRAWWGCPTVFLQSEDRCQELWFEMQEFPERGLRPVSYLDINLDDNSWRTKVRNMQSTYVRPMFIWCGSEGEASERSEVFEEITRFCKDVIFIPCGTIKQKKFWLAPRILGTSMGFMVRQNLTDVRRLFLKRCIDILFSILSLVVVLPLGAVIALCIYASTRSNPIFVQSRWGQGGQKILIYKFRTMVTNAEEVLEQYFAENPEMKIQWDKDQKIPKDPRITNVGHFLRKTSLDELPQIINVILGTMSLVGPRPILEGEVERYGDVYLNYSAVKPGITGLWQVSGRNLTTYEQRLWYANYYVTNWSLWMDLWILARTIPVVIRGHGAF